VEVPFDDQTGAVLWPLSRSAVGGPWSVRSRRVCAALEEVLSDPQFVAENLGEGTSTRQVLYEDHELGFCVLAHAYEGASESSPHDHGPAWAIFGQASGETEMTEWEGIQPASSDKAGKVRRLKTYALTPGKACLYNGGQFHSPRREGATRLIRIEGMNMDRAKRRRYLPIS
jgi:hypothetical protein